MWIETQEDLDEIGIFLSGLTDVKIMENYEINWDD